MENKENEVKMEDEFFDDDADALTLDDLKGSFISNPKVGESIRFTIKKIVKLTGANLIAKKTDGSTFKKNLSNVDYGYEITTTDGSKYTVPAWEIFGKMKSIFQKLGTIEGTELEITHIKDGMKEKDGDSYRVAAKVGNEYKSLNRDTKEWE